MASVVPITTRPRTTLAADVDDVMREQLEYLIEHAASGACGCRACQKYKLVREVLMGIFQ